MYRCGYTYLNFLSGEKKDLDTYEKLDKGEIYFPSRKKLFNMKNKNLKNSNKLIQKIQVNQGMSLNRILLSNERDIGVHYTNNYYYSSKDNFFKSQKWNEDTWKTLIKIRDLSFNLSKIAPPIPPVEPVKITFIFSKLIIFYIFYIT